MHDLKSLMLGAATGTKLTLSVAESLTCGRLQAQIGAISGASNFFLGGVTAYTLEQKVKILGVSRAVAEPVNCVSEAVAQAMARGACALFGSDIGVATTGYAEPSPADDVAVPFAWWAIVHGDTVVSGRADCPGMTRVAVQQRVVDIAYGALLDYLGSLPKATAPGARKT